ncbi:MAG: HEAT repeat domain-containing protein [Anaerolineales bacterium]|nr:HEAT repeat domain-containing protein [Anaerolineales bacterium]
MNLNQLLQGLKDENPARRLAMIRIIGVVEETRLLKPIRDQFLSETVPQVKSALEWAGKRLYAAHQSGYSTINGFFDHFNLNREIENMASEAEAKLIKDMESNMQVELMRRKQQASQRNTNLGAAAAIGGTVLGGPLIGAAAAGAMMSASASDVLSSNLGPVRDQISTKRTPAPRPSNTDVGVWLKRLREDQNAESRRNAAIELGNLNNPIALPYLATAAIADPVPEVREAAERFCKILYWSQIYWQMTQDGSVEQEVARRAAERGINPAEVKSTPSPQSQPPAKQEDITAILQRAQEAKQKKKRR